MGCDDAGDGQSFGTFGAKLTLGAVYCLPWGGYVAATEGCLAAVHAN
jgi:hypothetical protein